MTWGHAPAISDGLNGYRVLVVDDEALIALDLTMMLADAGAEIVGPAGTVADGLSLAICESLNAAVLDVRLSGETIAPVANALAARGVPMLFYSGQLESDAMLHRWPRSAFLPKPAPARKLAAALRALVDEEGRRPGSPTGARPEIH